MQKLKPNQLKIGRRRLNWRRCRCTPRRRPWKCSEEIGSTSCS